MTPARPRPVAGTAFLAVLSALTGSAFAQAPQGDVRLGARLAERWCMACHVVEPAPPAAAATDRAPSFAAIASRTTTTPASLAFHLSSGHTNMPDFALSAAERDALVAYILGLK